MSNEQLLLSIEDLITSLTFKRVFLLSLVTIISLILLLVFENRNTLFTKAISINSEDSYKWEMSDTSKELLSSLTIINPVLVVGIIDVDLKKNRRSSKWFYSKDAQINIALNNIIKTTLPQTLFDYDVKNTQQMVAVLNNEFNCVNTLDSNLAKWQLATKIPTICRMAIPPYVGKFVGYIIIGLAQPITKSELDTLRIEVTRIAIEVYIKDVVATTNKSK